jgi:hypothetical protein
MKREHVARKHWTTTTSFHPKQNVEQKSDELYLLDGVRGPLRCVPVFEEKGGEEDNQQPLLTYPRELNRRYSRLVGCEENKGA